MKTGPDRITSKARKSVHSPATNICHHYPNTTIPDFITSLMDVLSGTSDVKTYTFSDQDLEAIAKLRDEKYRTWDWIHARSPEYTITKHRQLNGREVHITLAVKDGVIRSLHLDGEVAHDNKWDELEKALLGVKLRQDDIAHAIEKLDLNQSIATMAAQDLVRALIN